MQSTNAPYFPHIEGAAHPVADFKSEAIVAILFFIFL